MHEIKPLAGVVVEPIEGVPAKPKRKHRKTAKTPEGIVKDAVKAFLSHIDAFWFMPSQNGRGDRTVDFIGVWRGASIAVETKKPGNDATDKQKYFLNNWRSRGGWAFLADSIENLMEQWSAECHSCGIRPPAICSMRGVRLEVELMRSVRETSKAGSSGLTATSASPPRSATSRSSTSIK